MRTLYVSDLDGTLLNDHQEIDQESVAMINELIEKGLNFTIATARSIESVREIVKDLHLKLPVILINGVFVYDMESSRTIKSNYLSGCLGTQVVQTYLESGLSPLIYTTNAAGEANVYYSGIFNLSEQNYIENRLRKGDKRFKLVQDYEACLKENIISVNAIDIPQKLEKAHDMFKMNGECVCHFGPDIYTPGFHWLEISSCSATKKEAVLYLKQNYHFQKVVCFGDNLNDIPMFEVADEKCAVQNAHESVIKLADKIIESNNNNGVAKYLREVFQSISTGNVVNHSL